MEFTLHIGDLVVSRNENATYTCIGLGSCIGLFLYDRMTGISGGAHIMLPRKSELENAGNKYFDASDAMVELLNRFQNLGSSLSNLRAKVTGGANVIQTGYDVGSQNAAIIRKQLIERKVFIAACDVGGTESRSASYHVKTGELHVRFPQSKTYKIY